MKGKFKQQKIVPNNVTKYHRKLNKKS